MWISWFLVCYVVLLSWKESTAINIFVDPTAVDTVAKSEVYVSCNVQPKTGIRVFWRKDNIEFPPYPVGQKLKDTPYVFPNNTLYIKSVKRRQTGEYQCVAFSQSTGEKTYKSVIISIKFMQQLDKIEPVRVFKDFTAEIVCVEPPAKPVATVSWLYNGKPIPPSDGIKQDGWTLRFDKVDVKDAGVYTCVASNSVKERKMNATLEVIIPGDIVVTPERDEIKEGETSSFNCVSKAIPPLPIEWKRVKSECVKPTNCRKIDQVIEPTEDNRISIADGKLTIRDAIPTDKGVYKCEASLGSQYDAMAANLNVVEKIKEDPKYHKRSQSKDMRENTAEILCKFRGDGTYEITWSRVNATKPLPSRMVANESVLTIHNITFEDAGRYRCAAKGEFNTGLADVHLVVYKSPIFKTKPGNVSAAEGESIWVHCQGEGEPDPKVSYHRNGKLADLNATIFQQLPNNTLYVKEVKKEYADKYHCWLTQNGRFRDEEFYIKVKDGVPIGSGDASPMGRTVGIAVGCAGVYILLVIGLMIYCRARRARLLKQGFITEVEDGELKDPLFPNEEIPLHNTKSIDDWQYPRENLENIVSLGHGKMGPVFKATAPEIIDGVPKTLVVVKQFDGNSDVVKQDFDLEMEMFVQLNHENVVKLLGVSSHITPYFMIIETGPLGDLKQFLQANQISHSNSLEMALSIASGMEYMVNLRYIHRDLAARNCVVFDDTKSDSNKYSVKISFLSLCEDVYKTDYYLLNEIPVPLRWLSPEAILNESYSEKSDVWSFGVTMWEIFSAGKRPYEDFDNESIRNGVCKNMRLLRPNDCPVEVYDVMKSCWESESNVRPTFKELVSALSSMELKND